MDNILLILILPSMVVSLIMIVLAIVSLVSLSGDNITEDKAKFATIMPPIAFGWVIGLLVYHLHTKKQLENNPELAKAGSTGNVIGLIISIVLSVFLLIVSFTVIINSIEKSTTKLHQPTSSAQSSENPQKTPSLPKGKTFENSQKSPSLPKGKTFETDNFSVEMDCAGEIRTQEKDDINTTLGLCVDITKGNFLAAETIVPNQFSFDISDEEAVNVALNSAADGLFQGAGATRTTTEKISPTKILTKGKNANQDFLIQFSVEKTSDGDLALYQLGMMKAGGVDKTTFDNFIKSFKLK